VPVAGSGSGDPKITVGSPFETARCTGVIRASGSVGAISMP